MLDTNTCKCHMRFMQKCTRVQPLPACCMYVNVCMHVCMYACMYVHMYVCMNANVCVYACMHVYVGYGMV